MNSFIGGTRLSDMFENATITALAADLSQNLAVYLIFCLEKLREL